MKPQNLLASIIVAVAIGGSAAYAGPNTTPVTITLNSQNSTYNESGNAVLKQNFLWGTVVNVTVSNEPAGETQYVFFQYGTCSSLLSQVVWPLNDLVNNQSNSTFSVPLSDLLDVGPMDGGRTDGGNVPGPSTASTNAPKDQSASSFAVTIWRYTTTGKTLVSCGDRQLTGTPHWVHHQ